MWKILFILLFFNLTSAKRQLPVGALFTLDEIDEVIAFRTSLNRVNNEMMNFELIPIIRYITVDDSFVVEQMTCDLVAEGVIAIFGPSSSKTSVIVSSICHHKGILHILFSWRDEETREEKQRRSMTLNVYPEIMGLSKAYADVIRNYQWTTYLVLYDTNEGLKNLQDVLQLQPPYQPITALRIGEGPDYRLLWKDVKEYGENRFIVDCSLDKIIDFLSQAKDFDLIGEDQHYFLTNLDTHTLDPAKFKRFPSNITSIRISAPQNIVRETTYDWMDFELKRGIKYPVDEKRVKTSMLLIHDAVELLGKALRSDYAFVDMDLPNVDCDTRTIWHPGQHLNKVMKLMTHNNSMVREIDGYITGRMDMNNFGDREFFKLEVTVFFSDAFHKLVTWNRDEGVADTKMRGIITEKLGEAIQNKTFRISTRLGDPFLMLRTPKDGEVLEGNARYEGYVVDLIHLLSEKLGFRYEFKLVPDGRYGSLNKDTRKWDGIIRQLIEGKADIGICDLTITLDRRQAVDFTVPFMSLGISILYAKPIKKPPNLFSFLLPFSFDVWITTVALYLFLSLLLFAVSRMYQKVSKHYIEFFYYILFIMPFSWKSSSISKEEWENPHPCNPDPDEVENIWTVTNSTWLTMGSIMGQGCDLLPKGAPMRLITGTWWFFALMMLNSYTANLAAFLTMSRMDVAIRNVEDLSKQSRIKYGVVLGGSTLSFFRDSNETIYRRMWAAMENAKPSVFTDTNAEGRDRVLKGRRLYAFLMESTSLEYITERYCELTEVGTRFGDKFYGIALPLNSRYRSIISEEVLRMSERGEMYDLKMKWWKQSRGGGRCTSEGPPEGNELTLEQVGGVFLVLGSGLLISLIIGICEFLWNVHAVAANDKLSLKEAFNSEAGFALKFWIQKKSVKPNPSEPTISRKSSRVKFKFLDNINTETPCFRPSFEGKLQV